MNVPKHPNSIDFNVQSMKVSLHLHMKKFKTNVYDALF
jgi:hypothetical protein